MGRGRGQSEKTLAAPARSQSKTRMYHVTLASAVDAILLDGLNGAEAPTPWADAEAHPPGNYFFAGRSSAVDYARVLSKQTNQEAVLFAVETPGLELQLDPEDQGQDQGRYLVPEVVAPQRLQVVALTTVSKVVGEAWDKLDFDDYRELVESFPEEFNLLDQEDDHLLALEQEEALIAATQEALARQDA